MWLGTKNCITVTLGYFCMNTNMSPGSNFLFAAQRAPYRPNLLCHVHSALVVLSIYSMLIGVFWPAHFLLRAQKQTPKGWLLLCAALCTMTSALTDLTSTSTAFAPCDFFRGALMSSLSSLWTSIWDHKNCSRHHRFYSRSRAWAVLSNIRWCCGRLAHLSHHHSLSDRND